MKTILVPVDFTAVSENAAKYALQLAVQLNFEKVVLYNAYEAPIPQNTDPMGIASGTFSMYDINEFKEISEEGLGRLKTSLLDQLSATVQLDTVSEYGGLADFEVTEICGKLGVDLIVTGTSDDGMFDETASDAIGMAKATTVPLIAVPADCVFKPLKNVVLACDLKKVDETVPVEAINWILNATQSKLLVLHIQEKEKENEDEREDEKLTLHNKFDSFSPEYYYVKNPAFTEAINNFAAEHAVDLIITIPKKHGWLEGLFKENHLKKLAFHSHIPLLMVHD